MGQMSLNVRIKVICQLVRASSRDSGPLETLGAGHHWVLGGRLS